MKKIYITTGGIILVFVFVIAIVAIVLNTGGDDKQFSTLFSSSYFTPCDSPGQTSELGRYAHAAVSSDAAPCAIIARDVMKRNGTAADAAIAGMFCVGVINAQSSGLGGGFVATYYSKESGQTFSLDAREVAPKAASPTMYDLKLKQEEKKKWYQKKRTPSLKGGLSVAVPGEVAGLYALYKRFGGGLPWKDLLEPAVKLCQEGYNLTWYIGGIMEPMEPDFLAEPSMSLFTNPSEERVLRAGETIYRTQLGKTLQALQEDPEALQRGPLAKAFVDDLRSFGGIITEEDLSEYRPKWRKPVTFHLENGNYRLSSFPPPGSGLVLGLILNILDEFNLTASSLGSEEAIRTQLRVVESFKYSYARRFQMGDLPDASAETLSEELTAESLAASISSNISDQPTSDDPLHYGTEIVPQPDDGTAHLSLLAPNGDAIAITSSINYAFGAGIRSPSTGIIYNNEMNDFTTDREYSKPGTMKMNWNLIKPGNRPLSSMSPTIITNQNGDVRLVLGAAGGVKIPSAAAWVAARYLWMGQDLKESVDACRTHHSLLPMKLQYEMGFPKSVLSSLENEGHKLEEYKWKSVVQVVGRDANGQVVANSDYRKSGQVAGF